MEIDITPTRNKLPRKEKEHDKAILAKFLGIKPHKIKQSAVVVRWNLQDINNQTP